MKNVFDEAAPYFARSIDGTVRTGTYARGRLFLGMSTAAFPPGGHILDYGCGPGRLSIQLAQAGFRVLGADISEKMLAEARAMDSSGLQLEFTHITEPRQVLASAAYDGIVCSSVIEYVTDADQLLQGLRQALRPTGALVISFANRGSLFRWYWHRSGLPNPMRDAQHHAWTWREFRRLLARNGFEAVTGPRYFEWPWDWRPIGRFLDRVPYLGSIGVVVARPLSPARLGGPLDRAHSFLGSVAPLFSLGLV